MYRIFILFLQFFCECETFKNKTHSIKGVRLLLFPRKEGILLLRLGNQGGPKRDLVMVRVIDF